MVAGVPFLANGLSEDEKGGYFACQLGDYKTDAAKIAQLFPSPK
jgi:hypothetical protein